MLEPAGCQATRFPTRRRSPAVVSDIRKQLNQTLIHLAAGSNFAAAAVAVAAEAAYSRAAGEPEKVGAAHGDAQRRSAPATGNRASAVLRQHPTGCRGSSGHNQASSHEWTPSPLNVPGHERIVCYRLAVHNAFVQQNCSSSLCADHSPHAVLHVHMAVAARASYRAGQTDYPVHRQTQAVSLTGAFFSVF